MKKCQLIRIHIGYLLQFILLGTVLIGILQKGTHTQSTSPPVSIGFYVYPLIGPQNPPLTADYFKKNKCVDKSDFLPAREVTDRVKLTPGRYCVVPCTFKQGMEAEFLLRIFFSKPIAQIALSDKLNFILTRFWFMLICIVS